MTGRQMLQLLMLLAMLVAVAWIAFYLLLVALAIGAVGTVVVYVRRWLIEKGIVTPASDSGVNADASQAETIEVEYTDITITQTDKESNHG